MVFNPEKMKYDLLSDEVGKFNKVEVLFSSYNKEMIAFRFAEKVMGVKDLSIETGVRLDVDSRNNITDLYLFDDEGWVFQHFDSAKLASPSFSAEEISASFRELREEGYTKLTEKENSFLMQFLEANDCGANTPNDLLLDNHSCHSMENLTDIMQETPQEIRGYISSLEEKGIMTIEDDRAKGFPSGEKLADLYWVNDSFLEEMKERGLGDTPFNEITLFEKKEEQIVNANTASLRKIDFENAKESVFALINGDIGKLLSEEAMESLWETYREIHEIYSATDFIEQEYTVGFSNHNIVIDGKIIADEIFNEVVEYSLVERDYEIEELQRMLGEAIQLGRTNDASLMEQDIDELKELSDEYVFSSQNTNEYVSFTNNPERFNELCQMTIEAQEKKDKENILFKSLDEKDVIVSSPVDDTIEGIYKKEVFNNLPNVYDLVESYDVGNVEDYRADIANTEDILYWSDFIKKVDDFVEKNGAPKEGSELKEKQEGKESPKRKKPKGGRP